MYKLIRGKREGEEFGLTIDIKFNNKKETVKSVIC